MVEGGIERLKFITPQRKHIIMLEQIVTPAGKLVFMTLIQGSLSVIEADSQHEAKMEFKRAVIKCAREQGTFDTFGASIWKATSRDKEIVELAFGK